MFVSLYASLSPLHALHQRHLVRRRRDVGGGGFALMDPSFDAVHRLLFFHLNCVTQT